METLQPKLRFPEFEGEWGYRKLENFTKSISSGKSKTRDMEGDYFLFGSTGFIGLTNKFDYSGQCILIARVGANAGFLYKVKGQYSVTDNTLMLYINEDVNFNFTYFLLIKEDLNKLVFGSGQPLITGGQLKKLNFLLPNLEEQTKIANFLSSIDEKINFLKEKKVLLEEYKKGMMQKIFNQEIRFAAENGNDFVDWGEKNLGEVADFFKGKGLPKSHLSDSASFKCIHYGELFTKYNELIETVISRTDIYDKPFLSISNDVLMPTSDVTPNGLATASCILEDNVILGGDILIIRQKVKILNGLFLSYYITQFREKVMKLVSGSTVYHLYGSDMKNLKVLIPCLKEQTKIANFLSAIDEKITLVATQIEDTQEYKKGLLQQMFV